MSYSFAASILYNNPAKLVNLTLDNLQQVGKGCDHFLYRRTNQRHDYRQFLSYWNRRHRQYRPSNHFDLFNSAGPMQNLLGPIAGLCPNLRTLTIRKVGEAYHGEFTREFVARDDDLYFELAVFINSVKGSLRRLVFEQGERGTHPLPVSGLNFSWWRLPSGNYELRRNPRPMDSSFRILLLSNIQRDWRDWMLLQSMEFRGVGPVPFRSFTSRALNGQHVSTIVGPSAKKMDHIGLPDPLAGVIRP